MIRAGTHAAACCTLSLIALGCRTEQRYEQPSEPLVMSASAAPAFTDDDGDPVYRVEQTLSLHLTPPSAADLARLAASAAPPFPRAPWVALDDLALQLDYALESGSGEARVVEVTVDGINEFDVYAPGFEDLHQWSRRVVLAPRARLTGSITELELEEVALDLATVVNGAPNSNLVVDPRSQARRDPRVTAYVPAIIPGLVGVRLGIESDAAADLTLTVTLRVRDHGDRSARRGGDAWMLPVPAPFTPIALEEE